MNIGDNPDSRREQMGNNSIAGANAVVVKDVPENCTVVGVPVYIVRRNGIKVIPAKRNNP
jgi:serine acetyltransferase